MRRTVKVVMTLGSAVAAAAIERIFFASPRWRGAPSNHFDGERFHNRERGWQTKRSVLKWQVTRVAGEWPEHPEAKYGPKPPERVDGGRLRVTFINHSTTLVQMDGVSLLTDPVWSTVGPGLMRSSHRDGGEQEARRPDVPTTPPRATHPTWLPKGYGWLR